MSEKIVQLNEEVIKGQLKELVRGSVEETLNELLEGRGRETDPGSPVRAQRTAPGVPQRPLQPQPHHHLRGRYPQGTQAQRDLL